MLGLDGPPPMVDIWSLIMSAAEEVGLDPKQALAEAEKIIKGLKPLGRG